MPRLGFPRAHSVVTSTTSVTHRCVRCGERDVHGVRHERARTWNVERWATTALSRDPAATRVTAETADLVRRSNYVHAVSSLNPFYQHLYLVLKHSPHLLTTHLDVGLQAAGGGEDAAITWRPSHASARPWGCIGAHRRAGGPSECYGGWNPKGMRVGCVV